MLMPLTIDMYSPALPVISRVVWRTGRQRADDAQRNLFSVLPRSVSFCGGPMADSLGRKPVILGGH